MKNNEKRLATIYDYVRFTDTVCSKSCEDCPVSCSNNDFNCSCNELRQKHTDKYNEILLNWIDEHPIKTYMDDFLEKFPKALKHSDNFPCACRQNIYGGECDYDECKICWYQPYEEDKEK